MKKDLTSLYPAPTPFAEGALPAGDGHNLHYYQFGTPGGITMLFCHGGPGEGVQPEELRIFDPAAFHIIALDQRGCGRSTPHLADDPAAALIGNNPAQLVADCEALRQHLQIDRWHCRGNSWGATLALLYAIAHPARVQSLLLSGVYLNRASDRCWYEDRLELVYPQQAGAIKPWLPPAMQGSKQRIDAIVAALEAGRLEPELAIAQAAWDVAATYVDPQPPEQPEGDEKRRAQIALGHLAAYYIARLPLDENWFRSDAAIAALTDIPITIRSGQYDIATPPGLAQAVANAHPHADFKIVPLGGHVTGEQAMADALLAAAAGLKSL